MRAGTAHMTSGRCAHLCRSQSKAAIIRNVQRGILVLLVVIISSIVGPGVVVALPELFKAAPAAYAANLVLTAWLTFNVVFNLVAATVKSAGVASILDESASRDCCASCLQVSGRLCSVPPAQTVTTLCAWFLPLTRQQHSGCSYYLPVPSVLRSMSQHLRLRIAATVAIVRLHWLIDKSNGQDAGADALL